MSWKKEDFISAANFLVKEAVFILPVAKIRYNEPMMTEEEFRNIMRQYGEAWENLDSNKLLSLFSQDATYQVTPFEKPYKGHKEIKDYWENVVKDKEEDVKFTLGNLLVKDNIGVAEWKASFIRRDNRDAEELRGIILIEVEDGKIKKLWEYWHKQEGISIIGE